jgi:hypothetical protein
MAKIMHSHKTASRENKKISRERKPTRHGRLRLHFYFYDMAKNKINGKEQRNVIIRKAEAQHQNTFQFLVKY